MIKVKNEAHLSYHNLIYCNQSIDMYMSNYTMMRIVLI